MKTAQSSKFLFTTTSMTRTARHAALALAGLMVAVPMAYADPATNALPTGGSVSYGAATGSIGGTAAAPIMDINQSTQNVVIDWNTFNIGKDSTVNFNQAMGASSVAVNRINDANPSQIYGTMNANGRVVLLNSNGIVFGPNSKVDVAGLVASTGNLDEAASLAQNAVVLKDINLNNGSIVVNVGASIKTAGLAAFVAPNVQNNGSIVATLGAVTLASGADQATVDVYGDGLVSMVAGGVNGKVTNTGTLKGAKVVMDAQAISSLVDSVVNLDGVVEATDVVVKGTTINLGTKVTASNSLTGSAKKVVVKNSNASINQGVALVDVGGTVDVKADTYNESVRINKTLTLTGANAGKAGNDVTRGAETIITMPVGWNVMEIGGNDVVVDGVKLLGGSSGVYIGAAANGGTTNTGVVFKNNVVENGLLTGIWAINTKNTMIENNLVNHTLGGGLGDGMRISGTDGVTVRGNTVLDSYRAGILVGGSNNTKVDANIVDGSKTHATIVVQLSSNVDTTNNTTRNDALGGIYYMYNDGVNNISGNNVSDYAAYGIFSTQTQGLTVDNNDVGAAKTSGFTGIYVGSDAAGGWSGHGNGLASTVMTNNRVDTNNTSSYGIYFSGGTDNTIKNNTVQDVTNGMYLYNLVGTKNLVDANTVFNVAGTAIQAYDGTNYDFTNNLISKAGQDGINVSDADHINVLNNTITDVGNFGVYFNRVAFGNIRGNMLTNPTKKAQGGIFVTGDQVANIYYYTDPATDTGSKNIQITGNTSRDTVVNGINLQYTQGTNLIDSNKVDFSDVNGAMWNYGAISGWVVENVTVSNNEIGLNGGSVGLAGNPNNGYGIYLKNVYGGGVTDNKIANTANNGISLARIAEFNNQSFIVNGNTINNAGGNGIYLRDSNSVTFDKNAINNVSGNGLVLVRSGNLVASNNTIGTAGTVGGDGIQIDTTNGLTLTANTINKVNGYGIHSFGGSNGAIKLAGNTVDSNAGNTGAMFENGAIDLTGAANTFKNGQNGLSFDGATVSLAGDTFGQTVFNGQTGFYINLLNGALFGPNSSTAQLDSRQVNFDGLVTGKYELTQATFNALTARFNDYLKTSSKGWVYYFYTTPAPGGSTGATTTTATANINDVLPQRQVRQMTSNPIGNVTILGMPYATVAGNTGAQGGSAASLANIAPAAGGSQSAANDDVDGTVQASAEELNNVDTAAGDKKATGCWGNVYSALNNSRASMVINSDPTRLLDDQQNCATAQTTTAGL